MKTPLLIALIAATTACASAPAPAPKTPAPVTQAPAQRTYSAGEFFDTISFSGASFSPDGSKVLIASDETGVFNAFAVPVDGSARVALTASTTNAIRSVSYFPNDERFLYLSDSEGDEKHHLYVRELDGGVKDLTPGEGLKAMFAGWSADDTAFYVLTNERDAKFFDIYRYAVADGYPRELTFHNSGGMMPEAGSKDGRWVALGKIRNNADSDIYLFDTATPDAGPKHITPHEGSAQHSATTFTTDGKQLLYLTDAHGEFQQAWSYDLASGTHKPHIMADWDVTNVALSKHGKYAVSVVNADAKSVVRVVETATGAGLPLPDLPDGDVAGLKFSNDERALAFYVESDHSEADLYVLELATAKHTKLTSAMRGVAPEDLVDGVVVRYPSFDGLEIPGILYKPRGASADATVAATLWIHGGPGGQSRHGYNPFIQFLVNQGYAVFAVNNRGSSGYGKTFFHRDDRDHGGGDLQDCVRARKYLESLDWIDGERVATLGGSYGGFMVLAALAFEPDAFEVGVDIFGVSNWLRTLTSIPPWWQAFAESLYAELGDPKTDAERLRAISPLFHADKITKPLLVIQGANDPRVLQVESDEIVAAVKANNVPVEYLVFADEGHGFAKRANRITTMEAVVRFFGTHMPATREPPHSRAE